MIETSQHTAHFKKSQAAKKLLRFSDSKSILNAEKMPNHEEDIFDEEDWTPFGEDRPLKAREGALTPAPWSCGRCGQANETLIDLSSGYNQEYVEDCAVCCRPNLITVNIDPESLIIMLANVLEDD